MSDRDQRARNSLKAQGRTPNDQRARRTMSIAITQEARDALDARAAREGKSISRLIEEWVLGRPSPRVVRASAGRDWTKPPCVACGSPHLVDCGQQ